MANSSRAHGLALMAVGMLVFSGTTNEQLPAVAFWPALVLCCIGFFVFIRANRIAMAEAEERAQRASDRAKATGGCNRDARERQPRREGGPPQLDDRADSPDASDAVGRTRMESAGPNTSATSGHDRVGAVAPSADESPMATGASPSVAAPQQGSLGEQILKLNRLREAGILSDEEFAIAKAKLRG